MSTNNKGLGRGLGALMSMFDEDMDDISIKPSPAQETKKSPTSTSPDKEPAAKTIIEPSFAAKVETLKPAEAKTQQTSNAPQEIDLSLIDRNISQPRKEFNAEEMHELEQSISALGVLQPIILNKVGTRFMVVAGERRVRAARNIGLKTIPAVVREFTPKQIAEVALVENLMRSDLNEIEVALGIKKLMEDYLMTQEQVSTVLGKSRPTIANSLRLLNLPREIQELLEQKKITIGHAKPLCAISDKTVAISLARKCADGLMTVRELEAVTSSKPNVPRGTLPTIFPKIQSLELKEFAISLTQVLSTKVTIQGDDKQGKIIIEYESTKDLERIKSKIK